MAGAFFFLIISKKLAYVIASFDGLTEHFPERKNASTSQARQSAHRTTWSGFKFKEKRSRWGSLTPFI
ncbi:hypothetical protein HMPREF9176_0282 [Streptococcus downei F0415]|nr:hypothetical protein HMPREF9176_0282 [Streptococcus downei F0415]